MTNEQIEQLKKLQLDIAEAEKAVAVLQKYGLEFEIRIPRYDQYYRLPIEKMIYGDQGSDLKELIYGWLMEEAQNHLNVLTEKRDELVLCISNGEVPNYKPTEL